MNCQPAATVAEVVVTFWQSWNWPRIVAEISQAKILELLCPFH